MRSKSNNDTEDEMATPPANDGVYVPGKFNKGEVNPACNTLTIIEISDKDYRSFALPCNALDESGDCSREG
ncbi:MAG: hypothetical protein R3E64_03780 [Halioglobus sp.]